MPLKRSLALALVLLFSLTAVACGSGPKAKIEPTPEPVKPTVNGHPCSPEDEAMQCILPPPSKSLLFGAPPSIAHGVDFAWGAPTVHQMRLLGAKFGASYFSHDPSKGWTQRAGLVSSYHAAGISTVGVWESTASRAGQGCAAGRADAIEAARQARAVGNTDRPITFAIDFDAEGSQVAAYFSCAHKVLGDRANAYGGYRPLKYLCAHHLVGHANWQTYAWSGGAWLPASCAPLEQYLNGSSVDYDRAIAPDYGQWPAPGPTPAQERAAKAASLHSHRIELQGLEVKRAELHRDIDHHRCRKGQHVVPYQPPSTRHHLHNELCPRWIKAGLKVIGRETVVRGVIHRLEKELR